MSIAKTDRILRKESLDEFHLDDSSYIQLLPQGFCTQLKKSGKKELKKDSGLMQAGKNIKLKKVQSDEKLTARKEKLKAKIMKQASLEEATETEFKSAGPFKCGSCELTFVIRRNKDRHEDRERQ